jgi:hypothetical protein
MARNLRVEREQINERTPLCDGFAAQRGDQIVFVFAAQVGCRPIITASEAIRTVYAYLVVSADHNRLY